MTDSFRFKQFTVLQSQCAMKVGTDAVLLGGWTDADQPKTILDIGTGTGVIALMLAQRFPDAGIDAVEVEESAATQAAANFRSSPWADRMQCINTKVQTFQPKHTYDLIVCNPPYFSNSLQPESPSRQTARHDDLLKPEELLSSVRRLISVSGAFCLILPAVRAEATKNTACHYGMSCVNRRYVAPTPHHPPKRCLLKFIASAGESCCEEPKLVVELKRHHYSDEFVTIARDFLLKL